MCGPLKMITAMTGTAESHVPFATKRGGTAFTRGQYMRCFTRRRRLSTRMETTLKNNYAFVDVIVKFCEIFICAACI
jgi:hypothetical protein